MKTFLSLLPLLIETRQGGETPLVHPRIDPTRVHVGPLRSSQGAVLDGMDHPRSHRRGCEAAPLRATPGSPRAARCRAGPAHVEGDDGAGHAVPVVSRPDGA